MAWSIGCGRWPRPAPVVVVASSPSSLDAAPDGRSAARLIDDLRQAGATAVWVWNHEHGLESLRQALLAASKPRPTDSVDQAAMPWVTAGPSSAARALRQQIESAARQQPKLITFSGPRYAGKRELMRQWKPPSAERRLSP